MRAAVLDGDGGVRVREVPVPAPAPGEVLVRVHSAGMNRADLLHARGKYGQRAFSAAGRPDVAGMEMSGRIVALGSGVSGVREGDQVMAMCSGAYADFVAVDHRLLLPVPTGMDPDAAGSLPMALLTEHEALVRLAGLRPRERVLVTGATSGVGLVGIQLARLHEPRALVGTSRAPEAAQLLRRLGADEVAGSLAGLAELAGPEGFDVVVDHVGGAWFETAVGHLRKGARMVSVGRLGARSVSVDLAALSSRRARLIGTTWKTQELDEIADTVRSVRADVLPAVDDGRVVPVVASTLDLDDIAAGYERLQHARSPGKVVVVVGRE